MSAEDAGRVIDAFRCVDCTHVVSSLLSRHRTRIIKVPGSGHEIIGLILCGLIAGDVPKRHQAKASRMRKGPPTEEQQRATMTVLSAKCQMMVQGDADTAETVRLNLVKAARKGTLEDCSKRRRGLRHRGNLGQVRHGERVRVGVAKMREIAALGKLRGVEAALKLWGCNLSLVQP